MKPQRPMNPPSQRPAGRLPLPYGKGCIRLLTEREVTAGIRHGKWWTPEIGDVGAETTYVNATNAGSGAGSPR